MKGEGYAVLLGRKGSYWHNESWEFQKTHMTFECVDIRQIGSSIRAYEQDSQLIPNLKLRALPVMRFVMAYFCLTQGWRLVCEPGLLASLAGFCLLVAAPRCCYLGWRDYCALKEVRVALTFRRYIRTHGRLESQRNARGLLVSECQA